MLFENLLFKSQVQQSLQKSNLNVSACWFAERMTIGKKNTRKFKVFQLDEGSVITSEGGRLDFPVSSSMSFLHSGSTMGPWCFAVVTFVLSTPVSDLASCQNDPK